jgi:hypothetical protein
MLNIPVGVCIQGTNFQFFKEEISHDQRQKVLVVTDFLFEELKICILL